MAKELKTQFPSDETLYAVVLDAAGQAWRTDTSVFENLSASNWGDYAVAVAEQSTTGIYIGNFPSGITAAGTYYILFRQQAGGSPAATDQSNGMTGGVLYWSGTAELFPSTGGSTPTAAQIATAVWQDTTSGDLNVGGSPGAQLMANLPTTLSNLAGAVGQITAGAVVSFVSPVSANGSFSVVAGDDYFNADGRALVWTASAGTWPNLSGATVQLKAAQSASNTNNGTRSFTADGVVAASGTGVQSVYVELPSATTSGLAVGASAYDASVVATLADGHVVTLVRGCGTVEAQS